MNPITFGRRGINQSVRASLKEKDELYCQRTRYPAQFIGPCAVSALAIAFVDKPTPGAVRLDRVKPRFNGDFSGILDRGRTWYGDSVTCPIQAQNSIGDRLLAKTIQQSNNKNPGHDRWRVDCRCDTADAPGKERHVGDATIAIPVV